MKNQTKLTKQTQTQLQLYKQQRRKLEQQQQVALKSTCLLFPVKQHT